MTDGGRPRVLLAVPDTRERLRLVEALRDRFDLTPLPVDEDPVRVTRSLRPQLVLLSVPRGRTGATLRACRAIATDAGSPPRVALIDGGCRLTSPETALQACLGDGYLGLELPDDQLVAFVSDVLAGKRPVLVGEPRRRGLLDRLLKR